MKYILLAKAVINKVLDKAVGPLEVAILGIVVISTLSYALAWQAPGGNPPVSNTDSPLNTGSTGQAKSGGLILNTGGAATGLIVQNGNVGIGTTNPAQKLHVKGSGAQYIVLEGTGDTDILSRYTNGVYDMYSGLLGGSAGPGKWGVYNNGAPRMVIDTAGNVGIGTTNPGAKLELYSNSGTGVGLLIHQTGVRYWDIKLKPSDAKLYITDRSAGADRLVIDSTGNVGIGTPNPTQKLDVAGYVMGQLGLCIGGDCRSSWSNESRCSWKNTTAPSSVIACDAGQVAVSGGCSGWGFNERGVVDSRPYPEGCTGNNCTGWFCLQSNTESRMYVRCCPL